MPVERIEWLPEHEAHLRTVLEAMEKNPASALTVLQFRLTLRQIRAWERMATALDLFVGTYAVERGFLPTDAAGPAPEATRGPGRMRR
jgi:hypothetical protein